MTIGHGWINIVFNVPMGFFPYIMDLNAIQYMQFLIISHNHLHHVIISYILCKWFHIWLSFFLY